ncbi:alpha/beta hydrolase [Pseudonocardia eucalypti]|uniref:Alpha/beta hydrolase n=1 Tax=Pseudonocardia eucalypti TaxID=648755 RepID=A0ABP9PTT0_9PSEU|nr:pimeloyl-ACP methyl ester carboxylesterase [Pseudonocardia eucalypti]
MKLLFVHGACVVDGEWWWHRMVGPLARAGLATAAVELPSCGPRDGDGPLGDLADDIEAVRVAAAGDEPVLLVSSSYGGMVITGAAAGLGNVRHLVYLSSMPPDADQPVTALADPAGPSWLEPEPGGTAVRLRADLTDEDFRAHFLADCDPAAVRGALDRIGRQSAAALTQPPGAAAWRELPSTAVICTEDRATPPDRQRLWAARAGRVLELAAGHHPFLSRPDELARLIAGVI